MAFMARAFAQGTPPMTKTFSPFFAALLVIFSLLMLAADRAGAAAPDAADCTPVSIDSHQAHHALTRQDVIQHRRR